MGKLPFEKIKRQVFVKKEADSNPEYGCKPKTRPTEELLNYGIINIDKPSGPSSHQVSSYLQKILKIKKAGHSGTLDPKVTGVLPIASGNATRIVQSLLTAGKEYICLMHLHKEVEEKKLKEVMKEFVGKIKQLPPVKSAVKREWRYRKVYYIDIIEIKGQDVLFRVGCQAGTYIRKLVHDMGKRLEVGAHMAELRRTKVGPFDESTLCTLQDLTDALYYYKEEKDEKRLRKIIQTVETGASHLPKIWVLDTTVDSLCHGASLKVPGVSKVESDIQLDEKVAVMTLKDELVLVGTAKMISKDIIREDRGVAVKPEQVFMKPGTYPKIAK
ncbi:MAG: RNA-guided pseudouridylation complex pseudouridine synthase subunit Cbf5 [archaeon]